MRSYILARRGINARGELEVIYKTNISLDDVAGRRIKDIEADVRRDIARPIGLTRYAKILIATDSKDNTISVVLRESDDNICTLLVPCIDVE